MPTPSLALPIALAVFVAFVLVLPIVRLRMRTGVWAVVVRSTSTSVESFVRVWTALLLVGVAAWAVLVPALGVDRVGAWPVPAPVAWIGAGLLLVGFAVAAAAQAHMGSSWRIGIDDAPTELVVDGLFRWVRHPIYSSILAMFAGIVCLTPAPWTVCAALLGYVLVAIQSRLEEDHLRQRHGAAYERWAARTGRFVPGVGRAASTEERP